MIILKTRLPKAIPTIFLIIALIATFGFITGFEQDETGINDAGTNPPSKWECPYCSYIYDPAVEGVPFEELPPEWVCPGCSSLKSDFVNETEFGIFLSSDPWIAHLQHVLAMRSKHLAVLARVIAAHEAKDIGHSSLAGLANALSSSSKSVLKAKAEINEYLQQLSSAETVVEEENEGEEIPEDEATLNPDDDGNDDSTDGDDKENNGNKDEKDSKEQNNNGKASGKNK